MGFPNLGQGVASSQIGLGMPKPKLPKMGTGTLGMPSLGRKMPGLGSLGQKRLNPQAARMALVSGLK
jgi:hypothetical protein